MRSFRSKVLCSLPLLAAAFMPMLFYTAPFRDKIFRTGVHVISPIQRARRPSPGPAKFAPPTNVANRLSHGGVLGAARLPLSSTHGLGKALSPGISSEVAATVRRLAQPILADETSVFAFAESDSRPTINTFFNVFEGRSISQTDAEILAVWRHAWSAAGWNPRVLNLLHVMMHPQYEHVLADLNKIPLGKNIEYDRLCYLRHFAMATVGGGWMADYDTVPLNMNAKYGMALLPNNGSFTLFEKQVPSLMVGSGEEWDRVAMALIREGVAALQRDKERELFSDMHSLAELLKRGEVIAHGPPLVRQVDTLLETMSQGKAFDKSVCNETKGLMALHFSHKSTGKQYRGLARPLAMAQLLQQWPEDCGADVFDYHTQLMDDNVGRTSPGDGAKHSSSGAISKDDEVSQEHTPSHVALTHNKRIERDRNSDSGHMNKQDRKNLDLCDTNDKSTCMLADIADAKAQLRTTPFFWHIPKAGGTSLKRLLTSCLNLLDASNRGSFHDKNETLFVVRRGPASGQRTVNVNLATKAGIQRARQLGLAESGLADVVASPLFLEASSLFTPENKGVAFAVFRHPVERAASLFHYLQHAEWEPTYNPELKNMPIEEFAKSNLSEENWVVRSLVGKLDGGEVSTEDLKVAKDIVRRKVIVGLTSDMETTVKRFSDFFGWDLRDAKKSCLERTVYRGENKNVHPQVVEGSAAWPLLVERNRFDLDLYDYVLDVFKKQGDWLG